MHTKREAIGTGKISSQFKKIQINETNKPGKVSSTTEIRKPMTNKLNHNGSKLSNGIEGKILHVGFIMGLPISFCFCL